MPDPDPEPLATPYAGTESSQSIPPEGPAAKKTTHRDANVALVVRVLGDFDVRVPGHAAREAGARIVAECQHGYIRTDQLAAIGWTERAIRIAAAKGVVTPIARGLYRYGPNARPRHAKQIEALLRIGVDAYLIGTSALEVLGLVPSRPGPIQVGSPRRLHNRAGIQFHHHPTITPGDRTRQAGLPMTTVARALLDAAPHLSDAELVKAFDEARHRHLTSPTKLRDLLERHPHRPGAARLHRLADPRRHPKRTESQLHNRALELIAQAGLPTPDTEVDLLGLGYRADLYWPAAQLALEIDSYAFHGADELNFNRDRHKDRLWDQHGIQTVRWSDFDIDHREHEILVQLALRLTARTEQLERDRTRDRTRDRDSDAA